MNLVKAKFCAMNEKTKKPEYANVWYVPFNPNEITISEACGEPNQQEAGKKDANEAKLQLSTTLFYNSFHSFSQKEYTDVRLEIRKFYAFLNTQDMEKQNLQKIVFTWGSIVVMGVCTSLQVKYTMFSPSGLPIRAEVSIAISGEYYGDQRVDTNTQGTQLLHDSQATFMDIIKQYQDPYQWKEQTKQTGVEELFP